MPRAALETRNGEPYELLLGLETLSAVLRSSEAAGIERKIGFTQTDLVRIARTRDPFKILRLVELKSPVAELEARLGALARSGHRPAPARSRSLLRSVLASALRSRR